MWLISLLFSRSCSILQDSVQLLNNFVLCSSPFFFNYFVFIAVIMKRSLRICLHTGIKSNLRNCQYRRYYQVVAYRWCLCNWVAASEHQFVFRSISQFHCNGFFFECRFIHLHHPYFRNVQSLLWQRFNTFPCHEQINNFNRSFKQNPTIAEKYSIMKR